MDQVYEKYGVDPAPHRKLSLEGQNDEDDPMATDRKYRRKTTNVGGSFYGRDIYEVNEQNFGFMLEAYETMLVAYLDVVERRKDTPFTEEDLAAQDAMRKNWAEDRLFSDPFTTQVTPYEIWSLMSVTEGNFGFMTEAYETMLEVYLAVVERRMNDPYTAQDLAAQDAMRKNWLQDRFFSDPFTTSVTPYEAWSLYSLPPTVKF